MYLEQERPPQGLSGMDPPPQQFNGGNESQSALRLDDGTGLRVVNARFVGERQFDWDLFAGYDRLRVLTYSASVKAIVRMLDQYSFCNFECVFGYECTLRDIKNILAFQKVVVLRLPTETFAVHNSEL